MAVTHTQTPHDPTGTQQHVRSDAITEAKYNAPSTAQAKLTAELPEIVLDVIVAELEDPKFKPPPCHRKRK